MNPATHKQKGNVIKPVLYMALELSDTTWKVVFRDGIWHRRASVKMGELEKLGVAMSVAKSRFEMEEDSRVVSCYEVGRQIHSL